MSTTEILAAIAYHDVRLYDREVDYDREMHDRGYKIGMELADDRDRIMKESEYSIEETGKFLQEAVKAICGMASDKELEEQPEKARGYYIGRLRAERDFLARFIGKPLGQPLVELL